MPSHVKNSITTILKSRSNSFWKKKVDILNSFDHATEQIITTSMSADVNQR